MVYLFFVVAFLALIFLSMRNTKKRKVFKNMEALKNDHDIELSELLQEQYDLYHFAETVTDNQLHFNYEIQQGQLKTRNAIKILGYPTEIVSEATAISKSLSGENIHTRYSTAPGKTSS